MCALACFLSSLQELTVTSPLSLKGEGELVTSIALSMAMELVYNIYCLSKVSGILNSYKNRDNSTKQ